MAKIIPITPNPIYIAKCPECGCCDFLLKVDGVGDNWTTILGTICANCETFLEWAIVNKEPEEKK